MSDSNSVTVGPVSQLSQLPELILDDIIFYVRQSIKYDGYLCHLRLVNSKQRPSISLDLGSDLVQKSSMQSSFGVCVSDRSIPTANFGDGIIYLVQVPVTRTISVT